MTNTTTKTVHINTYNMIEWNMKRVIDFIHSFTGKNEQAGTCFFASELIAPDDGGAYNVLLVGLKNAGVIEPTGNTREVWYQIDENTAKKSLVKEWRLMVNINTFKKEYCESIIRYYRMKEQKIEERIKNENIELEAMREKRKALELLISMKF